MRQRDPSWQILQLEPTGDVRAIKRAYAQRLKVVRPDEQAELFQQLRAAYEWALEQAPRIANASPAVTLAPAPAAPIPPAAGYAARPDRGEPTAYAGSTRPVPLVQPAPPAPPRAQQSPAVPQVQAAPPVPPKPPQVPPVPPLPPLRPAPPLPPKPLQIPSLPPVQPALPSRHPEPPRPPAHRPAQASMMAWQALLASCQSMLTIPFDAEHIDQLNAAIKTVKARLAASLRTAALEALEARMAYQQSMFAYCARDEAAPLLRLCCRAAFDWDKELKSVHPHSELAMLGMRRAEADAQYFSLLERARMSRALRDMLSPGMPAPRDRDLYRNDYRDDARQFVGELNTSLSGAARYWFDARQLARWRSASARPWPDQGTVVKCALLSAPFGLGFFAWLTKTAELPVQYWSGRIVLLGLILTLVISAALVLAGPQYHRIADAKLLRYARAMRYTSLATWVAGAFMLLLGIAVSTSLPGWQTAYLWGIALATLANLLVSGGVGTMAGHLVVMALFGYFLSETVAEFLPGLRHATALGYSALLAQSLFWLSGIVRYCFRKEPFRPAVRATLLAAGLLAYVMANWLALHSVPLALAVGLCWLLVAATGADLVLAMLLSRDRNGLGKAAFWLIGLIMTVATLLGEAGSPLAALQQMQAMVAVSISLGLLVQGYVALRQAVGRLFRKR